MLHGELKRDAAAERVAHHVDLLRSPSFCTTTPMSSTDVDEIDLRVAERGTAVPLQIDADHLAVLGELREHGTEHLGRDESAVEQEQRLALAADLVPVVHAVGGDVAARVWLGHGLCVGGARRGEGGASCYECDCRLSRHDRLRVVARPSARSIRTSNERPRNRPHPRSASGNWLTAAAPSCTETTTDSPGVQFSRARAQSAFGASA